MKKVFVDLEFCEVNKKIRRELKYCRCEIIQIGAVKLDEENKLIDRYDRFVKPVYGQINDFITNLTHIQENDLIGAVGFQEAMDDFLEWIGEERQQCIPGAIPMRARFVRRAAVRDMIIPD